MLFGIWKLEFGAYWEVGVWNVFLERVDLVNRAVMVSEVKELPEWDGEEVSRVGA